MDNLVQIWGDITLCGNRYEWAAFKAGCLNHEKTARGLSIKHVNNRPSRVHPRSAKAHKCLGLICTGKVMKHWSE